MAESARVAFEKALALKPELPEALIVRGDWARLVAQDFDRAQRDLDRAAALQGPTPELRSAQRLLARDRGERVMGHRFARECVALDPENEDLVSGIALEFFRAGEFAEADRIRGRQLSADQTIPFFRFLYRVETREAWRGPEAAMRLIDRAQADQPGLSSAKRRILMALGRMEEAGRFWKEQVPDMRMGTALLASHRLGLTDRVRAEEMRTETLKEIERGNRASTVWRDLVSAEIALGHREAALKSLAEWRAAQQRFVSQYRRMNGFHLFAIGMYSLLGQPEEDLALIREFIAAGWHRGFAWRHDWKLETLRNNPEFLELVRQEEAWAKAQPAPVDP